MRPLADEAPICESRKFTRTIVNNLSPLALYRQEGEI